LFRRAISDESVLTNIIIILFAQTVSEERGKNEEERKLDSLYNPSHKNAKRNPETIQTPPCIKKTTTKKGKLNEKGVKNSACWVVTG
jgi:hypothetical protein